MMAVSIAIMPGFLRRFTQDEELIAAGITYSTIVFLFLVVNMVSLAFEKIFQAVGRMKVSMVALITGCVCNILLDPVLIFGLGPVPAMGIAGAALATGIGQVLSVVVYLVVYLRTELPVRLRRSCLRPDAALDGRLYAIGVPAILNLALPSLLVTFLNGLLAAFSQSYVVVLGIYYKLQTFLYLPANGFVQGMRPLIGYNYGAREHARVKKLFQLTLLMSAAIMAAGTVICQVASGQLMGLFTQNPETIAAGQTALRIISIGFVISQSPPPPPVRWRVWAKVQNRWSSPCAGTLFSSCRWLHCCVTGWAQTAHGTPSGLPRCWRQWSPVSSTAGRSHIKNKNF